MPRRPSTRPRVFALSLLGSAALFCGCEGGGERPGSGPIAPPSPVAPAPEPLAASAPPRADAPDIPAFVASAAPVRLRVDELTRLERDEKGELRLTCHFELLDRFGHNVKWPGRVRVELYRPGDAPGSGGGGGGGGVNGRGGTAAGEAPPQPGPAASGDRQDRRWDADLTTPERAALYYDNLVTRTFVLPLAGLPEWVERLADGTGREPYLTLRVGFLTADGKGRERSLEGALRIRRTVRP
jgi:hypothetical protein